MKSDDERCAEPQQFLRIDAAFRAGSLAALRGAVDDPESVPNGLMPLAIGPCLEYAIYLSPLSFIRELLELGADTNPVDHARFPPLIAALSCSQPYPGSPITRPLGHRRPSRPVARTRIDELETPCEMAERTGLQEIASLLAIAR